LNELELVGHLISAHQNLFLNPGCGIVYNVPCRLIVDAARITRVSNQRL